MSRLDDKNSQKGILLAAGTNEFEVVEFLAGGNVYGINVAKVREVILKPEVTDLPQAHPNIDGIFDLRGESIALINLPRCLAIKPQGELRNVIVTEINGHITGFLIEKVLRIKRVSWKDLMQPPDIGAGAYVIGVLHDEGKMTLLLDFEMLASQFMLDEDAKNVEIGRVDDRLKQKRSLATIVFAEDSVMFRTLLHSALHDSGYTNTYEFNNGQEVWDYLSDVVQSGRGLDDSVSAIISDVEMPVMDGYTLLKKVRKNESLENVPVVLFSSLITEDLKNKGGQLGASAVVNKAKFKELIEILDRLIFG